jgi:excisionase family DNA binding protein
MPLLNTQEMAASLSISKSTLLDLVNAGEIPVIRLSEQILRYDEAEVLAAVKAAKPKSDKYEEGSE